MSKSYTALAEFVLEKLPQEPAARRIEITRALADVSAGRHRDNLLMVAALLEDVERNHRQLVLDFKRRTGT